MRYEQIVALYGGLSEAAKVLGTDRRVVFNWKGVRIPSHWQAKVEIASKGKLKADRKTREDAKVYSEFSARQAI